VKRLVLAVTLVAAATSGAAHAASPLAWLGLDPHAPVRDANRLYAEGKYEDATAAYNAALVDRPDLPELHFNLGDSTYKQGKYDEAISSFQKVETANDQARASRVAYNVGNATFRKGQALEQSEPQKALDLYAQALASYRRALGLTPDDQDSKFNHEFVTQRIAEVKKRLEEQKKQQEQQQQDQQQNQDQQQQDDQQKQDQQQQQDQANPEQQQQEPGQENQEEKQDEQQQQAGDEQQPPEDQQQEQQAGGGEQPEEQPKEEPQQGEGEQPPEQQQGEPQPGGEAVAGEQKEGELSKGEAAAILDSQRGEEVAPEEVIEKLQGGRVAEPAEDW
jgi:Ca-activated chloride channel family protein